MRPLILSLISAALAAQSTGVVTGSLCPPIIATGGALTCSFEPVAATPGDIHIICGTRLDFALHLQVSDAYTFTLNHNPDNVVVQVSRTATNSYTWRASANGVPEVTGTF